MTQGSWTELALLKELLQKIISPQESKTHESQIRENRKSSYVEYVHEICAEIVGPCRL